MSAYDTRVGEFRAHYAGFFDPGFGMADLGAGQTRAVLEVRSHDVPFSLKKARLSAGLFMSRCRKPRRSFTVLLVQARIYQAQGLQLAKHFLPPEEPADG